MNEYITIYKDARNDGRSEYESLGVAASYIAEKGTENDLAEVYDYFSDDLQKSMNKIFGEESNNERIAG